MLKKKYPDLQKLLHELIHDNKILHEKDRPFGISLDNQTEWTERQSKAIYRMLCKYESALQHVDIKSMEPKVTENANIMTATAEVKSIILDFQINDRNVFFAILNNVKDIPGRVYNKDTKKWSIPYTVSGIKRIQEMGFILDQEVKKWFYENTNESYLKKKNEKFDPEKLTAHLGIDLLRSFQKEGIAFIEQMNGRALIGDEMGLGKTLQALGWLKLHPDVRPAVVIVPATLKIKWQKEAIKWINEESFIINGRNRTPSDKIKEKIIIINYDITKDYVDFIKALEPKIIILDEGHRIKNSKAKRTKAVREVCNKVDNLIVLTGTPILNRPIEIFNAINLLRPDIFPSYYRFGQKYCLSDTNCFGSEYQGASNIEELHDLLTEHIMIRRLKNDVLKELPDKQKDVITFPIQNREEYEEAKMDVIRYIHETEGQDAANRARRAETLARFNKLKQLAVKGKEEMIIKWIKDFLETTEEKLVVFAIHKRVVALLMEHFDGIAVKIDGSVSSEMRNEAEERFQTDNSVRLFIGNIVAAGEGLTLTAASNVVFLELSWVPGQHLQAEDRIHRIGQVNSCMVYYLLADDTIEEELAAMIDRKQKIVDAIIDGTVTPEDSLLTELMEKYRSIA